MVNARQISVVLFQESGQWVAQCLEYDIAAQAETLKELIEYELQRVLVGHIAVSLETERIPFENVPSAPQEYWDLWRDGLDLPDGKPIPFRAMTDNVTQPETTLRIAA